MQIERFKNLFLGLTRAYGTYEIDSRKGKKATGKAFTKRDQVELTHYQNHLEGHMGLGVIPINDRNNCLFAAIDIDQYESFDIGALEATIENNGWPLVVCRSKSGGAHVYMFLNEEIPAIIVRAKLQEFAMAIGHPKAEIFPKQDTLRGKDDVGNWINLPYFNSRHTTRYGLKYGEALTLDDFLEHAESKSVSRTDLEEIDLDTDEFSDAPPCLQQLTMTGFPQGSMNNALFDMGVYARMKHPDDWQTRIYEYNQRFMGPGSAKEVQQIIRSLDKKKYIYKCLEPPICGLCNKVVCAQREFGIQSQASPYKSASSQKLSRQCILDEVATPVECYLPPSTSDDEPYWVFSLHGQKMDVTVDMVQAQFKFLREYLKKYRKMVLPIDENRWMVAINNLLDQAENIELADDAGPEGQLWIHLENFCTGKVQARIKDELVLGKPWNDVENEEKLGHRIYFRSPDFLKYLDMQRFKHFKERQIYAILRRSGARHHKFTVKNKCVSCWSVTAFNQVEGTLDVPKTSNDEF